MLVVFLWFDDDCGTELMGADSTDKKGGRGITGTAELLGPQPSRLIFHDKHPKSSPLPMMVEFLYHNISMHARLYQMLALIVVELRTRLG